MKLTLLAACVCIFSTLSDGSTVSQRAQAEHIERFTDGEKVCGSGQPVIFQRKSALVSICIMSDVLDEFIGVVLKNHTISDVQCMSICEILKEAKPEQIRAMSAELKCALWELIVFLERDLESLGNVLQKETRPLLYIDSVADSLQNRNSLPDAHELARKLFKRLKRNLVQAAISSPNDSGKFFMMLKLRLKCWRDDLPHYFISLGVLLEDINQFVAFNRASKTRLENIFQSIGIIVFVVLLTIGSELLAFSSVLFYAIVPIISVVFGLFCGVVLYEWFL